MKRLLLLVSLLVLALALPQAGCSISVDSGDDDDSVLPPGDDDDGDDDDDDGDDDDGDDDDTSGEEEVYDGPPEGLVPGMTWQEERDGSDAEVHSGFTIVDFEIAEAELPPTAGIAQDLGAVSTELSENVLNGRIDSIVQDTWDGDNDGYRITFTGGGYVHFILEWDETMADDYDARLYCEYEDADYKRAIYGIPLEPGLADLSIPEAGRTIVPLVANWPCWFFVVGYTGAAIDYTVTIIPESGGPEVGDDDDSAGDDDDSAGDDDDSAGDDDDSAS